MSGRLHSVLFCLLLSCLLSIGARTVQALDGDPALLDTPDKKPFVMTVMGVRKAFPVAADVIRLEIGMSSNAGPLKELDAFRIVSEDDPEYAYEKFVRPSDVTFPKNHSVTEVSVPEGFKAEAKSANITEFKRETVDLKLHAPMLPGKTYAVITHGHGSDVVSAGRAAYQFRFDTAALSNMPDVEHERSEERHVGKECRSRWSPYH